MPKIDEAVVEIRKMTTSLDGNITTALGKSPADFRRGSRSDAASGINHETDRCGPQRSRGGDDKIRGISDPDSVTFYELGRSLREVSAAARSLRLLNKFR